MHLQSTWWSPETKQASPVSHQRRPLSAAAMVTGTDLLLAAAATASWVVKWTVLNPLLARETTGLD